jgi:hypothetical protein
MAQPEAIKTKYLYKYPQGAFPYDDLVATNGKRSRLEREYELLDTGVFAGNKYFDVFVEYAKAEPEDVLIKISVCNRGPEAASVRVLPTFWFRNTWSWSQGAARPVLRESAGPGGTRVISASHVTLGDRHLSCEGDPQLLFTENETNNARLFGTASDTPYVKDGINEYVVHQKNDAVNPARTSTPRTSGTTAT